MKPSTDIEFSGPTGMGKSHLSISHRVQMFQAGLLHSESAIRDLISDAMAANMIHYLPKELRDFGTELVKRGLLKLPIN